MAPRPEASDTGSADHGRLQDSVCPRARFPAAGTTCSPTRPPSPQPVLHPGTGQPIGPDDLAPLFPMDLILQEVSTDREIADPRGGPRRAAAVATRRRCIAPTGWSAPSARARASTTRTRVCLRPVRTSRTPPLPRPTTTPRRGARGSPPRPAPASGAARWRWPRSCSGWSARSTWCGSPTTRSRTGG